MRGNPTTNKMLMTPLTLCHKKFEDWKTNFMERCISYSNTEAISVTNKHTHTHTLNTKT